MNAAANSSSDFATVLYTKLAGTPAAKNLFFSPFSIRVALAMCAVGARGETRQVLTELIGVPENVEEQNLQFAKLLDSIYGAGKQPFLLNMANALWGQEGYPFKSDFQETIADFYYGALHQVNFRTQPDAAVKTINDWASEKTEARITQLINRRQVDDDTRLVLTNVIYFMGRWDEPFKRPRREVSWHGPDGPTKVPMMHQNRSYRYYENNCFQALDIPYIGEQLSMLVVLPTSRDGLASVESQLATTGNFQQLTARLHNEQVNVLIPRFAMQTEFSLKSVLCALGADLIFRDDADFSGIGGVTMSSRLYDTKRRDETLRISDVVHKAFVAVNEEGTEAAAFTAVPIARAPLNYRPKVFWADHPFLFFIWHRKTDTVLFAGRVVNPKVRPPKAK
jgi:serpin B